LSTSGGRSRYPNLCRDIPSPQLRHRPPSQSIRFCLSPRHAETARSAIDLSHSKLSDHADFGGLFAQTTISRQTNRRKEIIVLGSENEDTNHHSIFWPAW